MKNKNKGSGFTLVELSAVIALISMGTVLAMTQQVKKIEQEKAQVLGNDLFQYSNAVRQFLANNPDTPAISGIEGTNWLKDHSECISYGGTGYGDTAYLPCRFKEATRDNKMLGDTYITTDIIKDGEQTKVTVSLNPLKMGETARPDLSGIAVMAAAAGTYLSSNGAMMSTYGSFYSDIKTAEITIEISNGIEGDLWIRIDDPKFKKSAYFDPDNLRVDREFRNISRIQNIPGEYLAIGREGGALSGESVVVDANLSTLGNLISSKNLEVGNNILVQGNGNIKGTLDVGGNLSTSGNISASGTIQADKFYDASGTTYFFAPGSISNVKTVNAEKMKLSTAQIANRKCEPGEIARTEKGTIMSCVNEKYMIKASWVHGKVSAGGVCVPGSFGFDDSNNLHVCR